MWRFISRLAFLVTIFAVALDHYEHYDVAKWLILGFMVGFVIMAAVNAKHRRAN